MFYMLQPRPIKNYCLIVQRIFDNMFTKAELEHTRRVREPLAARIARARTLHQKRTATH